MKNVYFERYAWKERLFSNYRPSDDLEMIVVIPCHNEPNISLALRSLNECQFEKEFIVIVIVNESTDERREVSEQNLKTVQEVTEFEPELNFKVLVTHQKLTPKKAGVGLARKIGMDEAAWYFEQMEKDGIIVCYDADCTCETNYLQAIHDFYADSKNECGIVYYEHRLEENEDAIIQYELFLRYYIDALRWCEFPYAYQTLGSCITVKSKRYQKEGGMNTRKAGEDFYFLHKVIPNGNFGEINTTVIHPSDRISDRVPFGTGHAIAKYLEQEKKAYLTYAPQIFEDLKAFISNPNPDVLLEHLPDSIFTFLKEQNFEETLVKMKRESTDLRSFQKKFFDWMDGFRILKFVHFARDNYYDTVPLNSALEDLNKKYWHLALEQGEQSLSKIRRLNKTASRG